MDGVEKAIRSALEKGDAQDREFREKIYRSAFAALERVLKANPSITPESATIRRDGLQAKISGIETEFLPAVAPSPVPPEPRPPTLPEATMPLILPGDRPPSVAAPPIAPAQQPDWDAVSLSEAELTPDPEPGKAASLDVPAGEIRALPRRRKWRPFAVMFLITTLAAAAGIAYWWTLDSGILKTPAERDTSVPNPPKSLQEESFRPSGSSTPPRLEGEIDGQRDWVTLFSPNDPTRINAPAGTIADIVREGDETFLRVQSATPGEAALLTVSIGQGLLELLAGGGAVFHIVARSDPGEITEISVSCDFANLGNCGRRRFEVDATPTDYLFEISLPDVTPGGGGTLTLNPDLANRNRAVNIFEIRVAPIK